MGDETVTNQNMISKQDQRQVSREVHHTARRGLLNEDWSQISRDIPSTVTGGLLHKVIHPNRVMVYQEKEKEEVRQIIHPNRIMVGQDLKKYMCPARIMVLQPPKTIRLDKIVVC